MRSSDTLTPLPVLSYILIFLNYNEVINNRRISKEWKLQAENEWLWLERLRNEFWPETLNQETWVASQDVMKNPQRVYEHLSAARQNFPGLYEDIKNYVLDTSLIFPGEKNYAPVFADRLEEKFDTSQEEKIDPNTVKLFHIKEAAKCANVELLLSLISETRYLMTRY